MRLACAALGALDVGASKLTADRIQATVPHSGATFLMRHLSVNDASSLSNGFFAARAQAVERMGYPSPAGTAVVSRIVDTAGKLTLNGHPFPPARPN